MPSMLIDIQCRFCDTPFRTVKSEYTRGKVNSCGCLRHGHTRTDKHTSTWRSFNAMWQRVSNKKHVAYSRYGGRGIMIHPEWGKFVNFLRDMGKRPRGKTLDRINNNEGYEMNNCRWATRNQQNKNRS